MDDFCESLMIDLASLKIQKPIYLPHDVIEIVLSRLPVKSLMRFKAVCKQWSDTISDPIFGHVHLQQSQNSPCSSFFIPSFLALRRAALENHQLQELSPLEYPQQLLNENTPSSMLFMATWCYCDGLFVISNPKHLTGFVVWNPSRRTQKVLPYPYPVERIGDYPRIGIYYRSAEKDYKVVMVGDEHAAVFSCKGNSWSETRANAISFKHSNESFLLDYDRVGFHYKESIYWIRYDARDSDMSEVVCFDGGDEQLKIVCKLDPRTHFKKIFSSRDGLYVTSYCNMCSRPVITKILPEWMEYEVQLPIPNMFPLCFTPQNDKVIFLHPRDDITCVVYDQSGREAPLILHPSFDFKRMMRYRVYPLIQTLFLL